MQSITALILTFNEEKHIERCLQSLARTVSQIVVIDSGSTDRTQDICRQYGAEVHVNPWKNYSSQFNWGLDHGQIRGQWVLRIDADEFLTEPLSAALHDRVCTGLIPQDVHGLTVNRIMVFMGRAIRWGGCGNLYMLRLFRAGRGRCEDRWMDEHIALDGGKTQRLPGELIDENLNNIGWWVNKHNNYATREAIDLLNIQHGFEQHTRVEAIDIRSQAGRKRWLKQAVYARLPAGLRSLLFFLYRYVGRLGFLDGAPGFAFHFMQSLWYRYLVDLKTAEIQRRSAAAGTTIERIVEAEYGFKVGRSLHAKQE